MTTVVRRTSAALPAVALAAGVGLFAASPALAGADRLRVEGELLRYSAAVPEGATARVQTVATPSGKTIVTMHLRGLAPNTEYGAHAHANPCGATGLAAGPHYQYVEDPVQPSTDPAYANPGNEIWLDFTTNAAGSAVAHTTVDWQFHPERRAESVIIHVEHTHTGPHDSGVAGARLACLTVDF